MFIWTLWMQFWQTLCLTRNRIFFVDSPKTIRNYNFKWKNMLKILLGRRRMYNPARKIWQKTKNVSLNVRKYWRNTFFSKIIDSPQKVPMVMLIVVLTTVPNKSQEKPNGFCSRTVSDNEIFLHEKFSTQKFQWICTTQFWRPYQKNLDKKPKTYCSRSGNDEEDNFRRKRELPKFAYWHV